MNRTINKVGLAEIHQFLGENHKLGFDHFSGDMLRAWAADAEFSMDEGNDATIEIRAMDCIHGRCITFTVSDAGIDSGVTA